MKILIDTSSAQVATEIRKLARKRGAKSFRMKDEELEDLALSSIAKKGLRGKNVSKATVLNSLGRK